VSRSWHTLQAEVNSEEESEFRSHRGEPGAVKLLSPPELLKRHVADNELLSRRGL
jgi:hypothetical protein